MLSLPHAPPSSESLKLHNTECCRPDSTPRSSPKTFCPRLVRPQSHVRTHTDTHTHRERERERERAQHTHTRHTRMLTRWRRGGAGTNRCLATRRAACLARRSLRFDSGARSTKMVLANSPGSIFLSASGRRRLSECLAHCPWCMLSIQNVFSLKMCSIEIQKGLLWCRHATYK